MRIKKSVALFICEKIRREYAGKWYTVSGLTCWYCMKAPDGNISKMRRADGYRGCGLVNDWYQKLSGKSK